MTDPWGAWTWCEEHQVDRYDGDTACDPWHQERDDEGYCPYHERKHGPMEFGDLCRVWEQPARRPWWRRWLGL